MNGQDISKLVESEGAVPVANKLVEFLWEDKPSFKPEHFSLREAWEAFVGPVSETLPENNNRFSSRLVEASQSTVFSYLTGNVLARLAQNTFAGFPSILDNLVTKMASNLKTERFVSMQAVQGTLRDIEEGKEYPEFSMDDKATEGPEPKKRGFIIDITDEAIRFDRFNIIQRSAVNATKILSTDRERSGIRYIQDITGYTSYYPKVNDVSTQTALYRTSAGTAWYNRHINQSAITLVDWTDINEGLAIFNAMTDENGDELGVVPNQILVPFALWATILRTLGAINVIDKGSASAEQQISPNILSSLMGMTFVPYWSPYMANTTTWYMGDFKMQFEEQEHYPISIQEIPPDGRRDIMFSYRLRRKSRVHATSSCYVCKFT